MKESEEHVRTVTTKGQVTIPAEIRRLLEVEPGDKVIFPVTEGTVELQPGAMTLEDAFGAVTPLRGPKSAHLLGFTSGLMVSEKAASGI